MVDGVAFNIMLSMPSGTDPLIVQRAAREFAQAELVDRRYVMVLHDHQANPHVHIGVRAESRHGTRLRGRAGAPEEHSSHSSGVDRRHMESRRSGHQAIARKRPGASRSRGGGSQPSFPSRCA